MIRAVGALVLFAIVFALGVAVPSFWSIDPDAAAYVRLARSLAESGSYALDGIPHGKYPPGLPILLSWLTDASGQVSYAAMHRALIAMLAVGTLAAGAVLTRLRYAPAVVVAVALSTALSVTFFELSMRYLRTETLFFAMSTLSLLAMVVSLRPRRTSDEVDGTEQGPVLVASLLAGAFMVAAIATRLAGVTLIVVPAWALLRRGASKSTRIHAVLLAVLAVGALGAWQVRGGQISDNHPTAVDYGGEMKAAEPFDLTKVRKLDNPDLDVATLKTRLVQNGEVFARACATLLTNVDKAASQLPVALALAALVGLGLVRMLLARGQWERQAVAMYVLGTIALYAVWPFNQQERFYVPLLPWLLLAAGEGAVLVWSLAQAFSKTKAGRTAVVVLAVAAWIVLALQRSDYPKILGRYSNSYAALLIALLVGIVAVGLLLKRGPLPKLTVNMALAVPLLVALPWGHQRFVAWPQVLADDGARVEQCGNFGPVSTHPIVTHMAEMIVAHTTEDDVLMTDMPKMMAVLTGRRCIPFVYRATPPVVAVGEATCVYYSGELLEAIDVLDAFVEESNTGVNDFTFTVLEAMPEVDGPLRSDGTVRPIAPTLYRVESR